jgi:hypothetical protein
MMALLVSLGGPACAIESARNHERGVHMYPSLSENNSIFLNPCDNSTTRSQKLGIVANEREEHGDSLTPYSVLLLNLEEPAGVI